jgi:acetylglutamate kinase
MASVCAWGTGSSALIYLTDVNGVMDSGGHVFPSLAKSEILQLRGEGVIAGGMLPKTESCLEAIEHGIATVCILPGSVPGVLRKFVDGLLTEGTCIHGNR